MNRNILIGAAIVTASLFVPMAVRVAYSRMTPVPALVIEGKKDDADPEPGLNKVGSEAKVTQEPAGLVVHVAGAVMKPGVYTLKSGQRVDDAIKAAGGVKPDAVPDRLNLAALLQDGEKVTVPSKSDHVEPVLPTSNKGTTGSTSHKGGKLSKVGEGWVNINTASAEELQRLPGVGPSMSAKIVEYRKQIGSFKETQQLMDVTGIGEKKFAKMEPFVKVK